MWCLLTTSGPCDAMVLSNSLSTSNEHPIAASRDPSSSDQRGALRSDFSLPFRAVYQDADIYLLDDPLSAVDAEVGKHLFQL